MHGKTWEDMSGWWIDGRVVVVVVVGVVVVALEVEVMAGGSSGTPCITIQYRRILSMAYTPPPHLVGRQREPIVRDGLTGEHVLQLLVKGDHQPFRVTRRGEGGGDWLLRWRRRLAMAAALVE